MVVSCPHLDERHSKVCCGQSRSARSVLEDVMRGSTFVLLGLGAILVQGCGGSAPEPEADTAPPPQFAVTGEFPCDPVGEVNFICDMVSPEDLAVIPGEAWAITSGAREAGRLHLLNVSEKTSTLLFPTPESEQRLDAETYPDCPGPLDLSDPDASRPHGLYLKPGEGDVHTLLVVHHGARESIEAFEVDAQTEPPLSPFPRVALPRRTLGSAYGSGMPTAAGN